MNRVKKMITEQNWWKGDLPEEVFQEALAIAEKREVGGKVISASGATSRTKW